MQDFRKLEIWQEAQQLAVDIRRATRGFKRAGHGALASQLTRAAESIVLNIVEGCGASTPREFARFLEMGVKSAIEVESGVELSLHYGILPKPEWQRLTDSIVSLRRRTWALRKKVLAAPGNSIHKPSS